MFWRRRQFRDAVQRQLDLFSGEHHELVTRARAALMAYDAEPDPEIAAELYGTYDDLAEDVELRLYEMCESFSSNMEDDHLARYVGEFDRQARRSFGDLIPRLNMREPRDSEPDTGPLEPEER